MDDILNKIIGYDKGLGGNSIKVILVFEITKLILNFLSVCYLN